MQDKIFSVLGVVAFFTSMFVVSGVVDDSAITMGIVIAALSALLIVQIWRRFDRRRSPTTDSRSDRS